VAHCVVPEAEAILDQEFPVLDKGFVRLVDYLGGDQRIVQAARVSYGEGTKSYRKDAALIGYLLRNEHTSPFEQVVLTFHTKMPVFVARQWVRHRTARLNEISGRYSILKSEFYVPAEEDVCAQSSDNKQGRTDEALPEDVRRRVIDAFDAGQEHAYGEYEKLLEEGVARELARINLPVSVYTEWYWQIDLHNLFRFLRLRMDYHAQREIRAYAETMFEITKKIAPAASAAFEEHVLGAVSFGAAELDALTQLLPEFTDDQIAERTGLSGRALARFLAKLRDRRRT
jgi:thymidylate synthase (FAD)